MAIPDFQTLMLPLLECARAGRTRVSECVPDIAAQYSLTADELAEMLPSRRQLTVVNRLHWARTYLAKAGLLEMVKRGVFRLSDSGADVLRAGPARVDMKFLEQFESYRAWRALERDAEPSAGVGEPPQPSSYASIAPSAALPVETPEARIETAIREIEAALADELLARLLGGSPSFFENAVLRLLTAMGYGGGRDGAEELRGGPGDGGIDGVINEDVLGLDAIYVQAKRYARENIVGRPALQQFVGSLTGEGATKGVFVTTSGFSVEARRYVEKISQRIVLIDGQRLARLMIVHGVGVQTSQTITLSEIDENFFAED